MKRAVLGHYSECEVLTIPVADGGEGTVECFLHALKGEKSTVETCGPSGERVLASCARSGNKAVIGTAGCAGLPIEEGRHDPSGSTAFGIGQLVRHAIQNGCGEIIPGLGGSRRRFDWRR